MNLQEFLQSGLLESYILGHCNATEKVQVELMLEQHQEVRKERDAIETALEQYAQSQAVTPPNWLKGKILDQIGRAPDTPNTSSGTPPSGGPVQWILGAAFVAATAMGLLYFSRSNDLQAANHLAQEQLKACDTAQQENSQLQAFLLHPATNIIRVNWADTTKTVLEGQAIVYDNRQLNQVYVQVINMPPLAADKDYQFWVVKKSDPTHPIPYTVFQFNSGIFNLRNSDEIVAFAVSIEPKGGTPNGVPSDVVMLGKPI